MQHQLFPDHSHINPSAIRCHISRAGICEEKNFRCLGLLASFQGAVSPLFVIPAGLAGPQCPGELVFPAPRRPLCGYFSRSGLFHQLFWLNLAIGQPRLCIVTFASKSLFWSQNYPVLKGQFFVSNAFKFHFRGYLSIGKQYLIDLRPISPGPRPPDSGEAAYSSRG